MQAVAGRRGERLRARRSSARRSTSAARSRTAPGSPSADYLLACDLEHRRAAVARRAATARLERRSSTRSPPTAAGTLYAGGGFSDLAGIAAANKVARLDGGAWHALGSGPGPGGGALDQLRAQPRRRRDGRLRRHRLVEHRRDPAGRPRREVERLGVERARRERERQGRDASRRVARLRARRPPARASSPAARSRTRTATRSPTTSSPSTARRWKPLGSNGAGNGALNADVHALATFGGTARTPAAASRAPAATALASFARLVPARRRARRRRRRRRRPRRPAAAARTAADRAPPTGDGARQRPAVHGGHDPYSSTVDVTRGRLVLRTDTGTLTVSGAGGITAAFMLAPRHRPRQADRRAAAREGQLQRLPEAADERATAPRDDRAPGLGQRQGPLPHARPLLPRRPSAARTGSPPTAATARSTRVTQGVVQVNDMPRNRQVTLRAGGSYLADGPSRNRRGVREEARRQPGESSVAAPGRRARSRRAFRRATRRRRGRPPC